MFHTSRYRPTLLASILSLILASPAYSSVVRSDIDYQYFRDFAENKGQFTVGASHIPIYNKQGELVGTMLPNLPMPDLRVVNKQYGVAAAIDSQYVTSVAHNRGYGDVSFGNEGTNADEHTFSYKIVARNNHGSYDYHIPRLHKLITEVAPMPVSNVPYDGKNPQNNSYTNAERFPYFVRVGSGSQSIRDIQGEQTSITGAYNYLTGGAPLPASQSKDNWFLVKGSVFSDIYGPMATYGMPGDSGSSLFAYDAIEKRWVAAGVLSTYAGPNGEANTYTVSRPDLIAQVKQEDSVEIHSESNKLIWQPNGNQSTITQANGKTTNVALYDSTLTSEDPSPENRSLEAGKNVHFYGSAADLTLTDSINQGAGALYFHTNITVSGTQSEQTWLGGGIDVDKEKTVTWSVHNPQNDRLSKIGAGTLIIHGKGENLGDISVGDGTVILAQQALNGKQQAFNQVGITSGRATVVLADEHQVKPDNIYFSFRGGRLDANGNNLSFSYIQNADEGARIVNHHSNRASNITITGIPKYTAEDIEWLDWGHRPTTAQGLYEYVNIHQNKRTDYFVLKDNGNPYSYFPTNATSSSNWEYLGSDKQSAIETVLNRTNETLRTRTFSGYFGENAVDKNNGLLNISYQPTHSDQLLVLNGGTDLDGALGVERGTLLLSGIPVAHARDMLNKTDVIYDNEWVNRAFKATQFTTANGGAFVVGRNVDRLEGDFVAKDTARFQIGFLQNQTESCIRSDYTGGTHCDWQAVVPDNIFANLPTTQVLGNFTLEDRSSLTVGKSHLHSQISGSAESNVNLSHHSQWTMTGDSRIGTLNMDNASLTLNPKYEAVDNTEATLEQFNTLTIEQDLSGKGVIHYLANTAENKSDSIVINGKATGEFILALKNTGAEPNMISPLSLLKINSLSQDNEKLTVALENGYVDLGAYRYILTNQSNDYRLFSPLKAAEQAEEKPTTPADNTVAQPKPNTAEKPTTPADNAVVQPKPNTAEKPTTPVDNAVVQPKPNTAEKPTTPADNAVQPVLAPQVEEKPTVTVSPATSIQKSVTETPITQSNFISRYANTALSELSSTVNAALQIGQTVDRHLLNDNKTDTWVNYQSQKSEHHSNDYRSYEQQLNLVQIGAGKEISPNLFIGAIFSHSESKNSFAENVEGKGKFDALSLYIKKQWHNGLFASFDSNLGKTRNHISYDAQAVEFQRNFASVGLNFGKKWDIADWQIQPSIGIRYSRFSNASYQLEKARIESPQLNFITYNVGLKVNKTFNFNGLSITPSVASYYNDASQQDLNIHDSLSVNDVGLSQQFGRYFSHEFGLAAQLNQWQLATNIGVLTGSDINKQTYAALKLSYYWK